MEVLNRDEWCCQCCYDPESTLHVHHRYYEPKKDVWDYPLEAFVTLCKDCHEHETTARKEVEKILLRVLREKFLCDDVCGIAAGFKYMKLLHVPEVVSHVLQWTLQNSDIQIELTLRYFEYLKVDNQARKNRKIKSSI